jgi:hypothetical protein
MRFFRERQRERGRGRVDWENLEKPSGSAGSGDDFYLPYAQIKLHSFHFPPNAFHCLWPILFSFLFFSFLFIFYFFLSLLSFSFFFPRLCCCQYFISWHYYFSFCYFLFFIFYFLLCQTVEKWRLWFWHVLMVIFFRILFHNFSYIYRKPFFKLHFDVLDMHLANPGRECGFGAGSGTIVFLCRGLNINK